jgi:hypothetical protein
MPSDRQIALARLHDGYGSPEGTSIKHASQEDKRNQGAFPGTVTTTSSGLAGHPAGKRLENVLEAAISPLKGLISRVVLLISQPAEVGVRAPKRPENVNEGRDRGSIT